MALPIVGLPLLPCIFGAPVGFGSGMMANNAIHYVQCMWELMKAGCNVRTSHGRPRTGTLVACHGGAMMARALAMAFPWRVPWQ